MIGALFFLIWNSWKNRLKMRVRRLKQPKYLVGAIFGGLYFLYMFGLRFLFGAAYSGKGKSWITPENALLFESVGALILFVVVLLAWVLPNERAAMVFSEAEIAFLFPAPVSRRKLIHYKLLKSQLAILMMIFILTIFFGRFWMGGMAWVRAFSWWIILSTLRLHFLASSFVRTILLDRGVSSWKRRTAVLVLVGAALAAVVIWAKQTVPPPPAQLQELVTENRSEGIKAIIYYFQEATKAGPMPYLLYPFRIVVRPYIEGVTGTPGSFLLALWPALLLMAAHYWWVMRANVSFEEASIEVSKKRAEQVALIRANRGQWVSKPKKKKRAPFKLKPRGTPAMGLLWKNLIGAGSIFTWRFWLIMGCTMIPLGTTLAQSRNLEAMTMVLGPMVAMIFVMSLFFGPQVVRQDFRTDLPMADVLKTYPLKGWQMALGELLAPAVILTAFQWVLLILSVSLTSKWEKEGVGLGMRLAIASGAGLVAPALNMVSLLIPNAAVLIFPGWLQSGKEAPQGIEATGQRLIFMLGQMVVMVVALLPAVVAGTVIYIVGQMMLGPILPIPLAAVGVTLILGVEAWFGILWMGKLFEKFDVAAESNA